MAAAVVVVSGYCEAIWWRGQLLVAHPEERVWHRVGQQLEGYQVCFKCSGCLPGVQHLRVCTPNALHGPRSLVCKMCSPQGPQGGLRNAPVSRGEAMFIAAITKAGLSHEFAAQVRPTWWSGAADFLHIPTQTFVFVDGSSHFRATRGTKRPALLDKDCRCCEQAWAAGARVARVHDGDDPTLLLPALTGRATLAAHVAPMLLLSPFYASVWWHCGEPWGNYVEVVQAGLGITPLHLAACGSTCFTSTM